MDVSAFLFCSYYPLQDSNIIGYFTVLPGNASSSDLAAAQAANDPAALLSGTLAQISAAEAAQQAAMKDRLDVVKPLLSSLIAELPPSLTISGLSPGNPVVWLGVPGQICFRLPPSGNINPKGLVLYAGDSLSGSYFTNALGPGNQLLSADYQGCTSFTVSPGVPVGNYTIVLQDYRGGSTIIGVSFAAAKALVGFLACSPGKAVIALTLSWSVDAAHATVQDVVKIYNAKQDVVFWFFTSCMCQSVPGPTPSLSGSIQFKVLKMNSVPGGYSAKFYPKGGEVVTAVSKDWIPWAKLGW